MRKTTCASLLGLMVLRLRLSKSVFGLTVVGADSFSGVVACATVVATAGAVSVVDAVVLALLNRLPILTIGRPGRERCLLPTAGALIKI